MARSPGGEGDGGLYLVSLGVAVLRGFSMLGLEMRKSNVQVRVFLAGTEVHRTKVARGTRDPEWEEPCVEVNIARQRIRVGPPGDTPGPTLQFAAFHVRDDEAECIGAHQVEVTLDSLEGSGGEPRTVKLAPRPDYLQEDRELDRGKNGFGHLVCQWGFKASPEPPPQEEEAVEEQQHAVIPEGLPASPGQQHCVEEYPAPGQQYHPEGYPVPPGQQYRPEGYPAPYGQQLPEGYPAPPGQQHHPDYPVRQQYRPEGYPAPHGQQQLPEGYPTPPAQQYRPGGRPASPGQQHQPEGYPAPYVPSGGQYRPEGYPDPYGQQQHPEGYPAPYGQQYRPEGYPASPGQQYHPESYPALHEQQQLPDGYPVPPGQQYRPEGYPAPPGQQYPEGYPAPHGQEQLPDGYPVPPGQQYLPEGYPAPHGQQLPEGYPAPPVQQYHPGRPSSPGQQHHPEGYPVPPVQQHDAEGHPVHQQWRHEGDGAISGEAWRCYDPKGPLPRPGLGGAADTAASREARLEAEPQTAEPELCHDQGHLLPSLGGAADTVARAEPRAAEIELGHTPPSLGGAARAPTSHTPQTEPQTAELGAPQPATQSTNHEVQTPAVHTTPSAPQHTQQPDALSGGAPTDDPSGDGDPGVPLLLRVVRVSVCATTTLTRLSLPLLRTEEEGDAQPPSDASDSTFLWDAPAPVRTLTSADFPAKFTFTITDGATLYGPMVLSIHRPSSALPFSLPVPVQENTGRLLAEVTVQVLPLQVRLADVSDELLDALNSDDPILPAGTLCPPAPADANVTTITSDAENHWFPHRFLTDLDRLEEEVSLHQNGVCPPAVLTAGTANPSPTVAGRGGGPVGAAVAASLTVVSAVVSCDLLFLPMREDEVPSVIDDVLNVSSEGNKWLVAPYEYYFPGQKPVRYHQEQKTMVRYMVRPPNRLDYNSPLYWNLLGGPTVQRIVTRAAASANQRDAETWTQLTLKDIAELEEYRDDQEISSDEGSEEDEYHLDSPEYMQEGTVEPIVAEPADVHVVTPTEGGVPSPDGAAGVGVDAVSPMSDLHEEFSRRSSSRSAHSQATLTSKRSFASCVSSRGRINRDALLKCPSPECGMENFVEIRTKKKHIVRNVKFCGNCGCHLHTDVPDGIMDELHRAQRRVIEYESEMMKMETKIDTLTKLLNKDRSYDARFTAANKSTTVKMHADMLSRKANGLGKLDAERQKWARAKMQKRRMEVSLQHHSAQMARIRQRLYEDKDELFEAAKVGACDMFIKLKRVDPELVNLRNFHDSNGRSPLNVAAQHGHHSIVSICLKPVPADNEEDSMRCEDNLMSLCTAASLGRPTLLHSCVLSGKLGLVEYLVNRMSANSRFPSLLFSKTKNGWTAHDMAAIHQFTNIRAYLRGIVSHETKKIRVMRLHGHGKQEHGRGPHTPGSTGAPPLYGTDASDADSQDPNNPM